MIAKEDNILIKNLRESKGYGSQRLISFLIKTGNEEE